LWENATREQSQRDFGQICAFLESSFYPFRLEGNIESSNYESSFVSDDNLVMTIAILMWPRGQQMIIQ
jgi:hypothetical protein